MNKKYCFVDPHFLLEFAGSCSKQSREFMFFIFKNVNPYTNMLIGTYKDMSQSCGISRQLVSRRIQQLNKVDLLRNAGSSMWMVNPSAFFSGEEEDFDQMVADYENLPM